MSKISVIIPIYNAARYLQHGLDSVLRQSYADWEAICVDDGSTDDSGSILDKFAAQDTRFKVIHQENRGTLIARQVAVAAATGDWCLFLDPDDTLEPHALEIIAATAAKTDAEVIQFGFNLRPTSEMSSSTIAHMDRQLNAGSGVYSRDEVFLNAFVKHVFPVHLIGKCVRADVCKKAFAELMAVYQIFHEDMYALYHIIARATKLEVISDRLYNYRVGVGISFKTSIGLEQYKKLSAGLETLRELEDFAQEFLSGNQEALHALEGIRIRRALALLANVLDRLDDEEARRLEYKRLETVFSRSVLTAAIAEWYRLKSDRLIGLSRELGFSDLLGEVALRQVDYLWRGHNSRLVGHDNEIAALGKTIDNLKKELYALNEELCLHKNNLKVLREDLIARTDIKQIIKNCFNKLMSRIIK